MQAHPSTKLWQPELVRTLPDIPSGVECPCLRTLEIDAGQSVRGSLHTKGCHDDHISPSEVLQTSRVLHGEFRMLRTVPDKSCLSLSIQFNSVLLTCHHIISGSQLSVLAATHLFLNRGGGSALRLLLSATSPK